MPEYLVDFYGAMRDAFNAGDESDRLLIRWRLDSERAESAAAREPRELDVEKLRGWGAAAILSAGPGGEPVAETSGSRVLLCGTPSDIVAMRKENPDMARAWRVALRRALSGPMAHGYRILLTASFLSMVFLVVALGGGVSLLTLVLLIGAEFRERITFGANHKKIGSNRTQPQRNPNATPQGNGFPTISGDQ